VDPSANTSGRSSRSWLWRSVALLAVSLLSVWLDKLALFMLVGVLISSVALPTLSTPAKRIAYSLHAIAGLAALVGLVRFVILNALPGVVEAGDRAASKQAVAKLRSLVVAQDVMRRFARIDPDGDGIGSAALLPELSADVGLRGKQRLEAPLVNRELQHLADTSLGPAAGGGGYLYLICLPKLGGGWTARPGDAIDEEQAERRWVGYAWPAQRSQGLHDSYFIDEHERILVFANNPGGDPKYLGTAKPPHCDAALVGDEAWLVWQGKRARDHLPGDPK